MTKNQSARRVLAEIFIRIVEIEIQMSKNNFWSLENSL
jgi:hypothetical protein